MSPGISDSRWPPQRPAIRSARPADADSALDQYPSYLASRPVEAARRFDHTFRAIATAFVLSLLGEVLVGILLVLCTEVSVATLEPVLVVVGLLCLWSQLLRFSVDRAFLLAFWGQVTAVVADLPFRHLDLPVGMSAGSAAAIGVMYLLARFRRHPR